MKLSINPNNEIPDNILTYEADDYAFNTRLITEAIDFTIIVNRLNLVVVNGSVNEVWGLCPYTAWQRVNLSIPHNVTVGKLVVEGEPKNGYNYDLTKRSEWQTYVDQDKGWVAIGDINLIGEAVKFMPDSIAIVKNNRLMALWLHPQKLPKF